MIDTRYQIPDTKATTVIQFYLLLSIINGETS